MRSTDGQNNIIKNSVELEEMVMRSNDISVFFDPDLCYCILNDAACKELSKKPKDLIGHSILDIYPDIVASVNHRNLLRALDGQTIKNVTIDFQGKLYKCTYKPIYQNNKILGVLVTSSKPKVKE